MIEATRSLVSLSGEAPKARVCQPVPEKRCQRSTVPSVGPRLGFGPICAIDTVRMARGKLAWFALAGVMWVGACGKPDEGSVLNPQPQIPGDGQSASSTSTANATSGSTSTTGGVNSSTSSTTGVVGTSAGGTVGSGATGSGGSQGTGGFGGNGAMAGAAGEGGAGSETDPDP